jgi:hypothetical protein
MMRVRVLIMQNSAIKCGIQKLCSYTKRDQNFRILLLMNFATIV